MLPYYLKGRKNTENVDAKVVKGKDNNTILSSKCAAYGSKKSKCIK